MAAFEAVIGLEVHAQLLTQSKAFCFVSNQFGAEENSRVGPVSGGLPGALPVLNQEAVKLAARAGFALNCVVNKRSVFSRKNYFYPDLPKGYQISQFDEPICGPGHVDIRLENGKTKRIGVTRIHIEEDAGKSSHIASMTLVNLNRSGVPLVEIVSDPDMRSPAEASAYLRKVHAILVFAGICDGNLEEGNFRCDANVSVRPLGQKEFGTRSELKNINSFRFVEKAIDYEIARQIALIEAGGKVIQETRGWDSAASKTFSMRTKEEAHDYRYFPDPDLPPLLLTDAFLKEVRDSMPELPEAKKARFAHDYQLSEQDGEQLTSDIALAKYFETTVALGAPAKAASNWILTELIAELKDQQIEISKSPIEPARMAALLALIDKGTISGKIAKTVFREMMTSKESPEKIVETKGLVQVLDTGAIEAWIDQVLAANSSQVAEYKSGKPKLMGYFVGEVMKLSKGKANPPMVTAIIEKKLGV